MAQFTAQGRLKLLLDHKDISFHFKCRSIQTHTHQRLRYLGSYARLYYSSSLSTGTNRCNVVARPTVGNEGVHDHDQYHQDDEFENDELSCFSVLVLDISYRPVNVVGWKRAICLEFMEKADVLEYYAQTVNSPSGSFYIPAVLMVPHLLQVVKRIVKNSLSWKNILFRDNYTCQYCSSYENLTIDHVVPIALGGEWKWENLVTACAKCNSKKGRKTIEEAKMTLIKVPKAPKNYEILAIPLTSAAVQMLTVKKETPEEWRQYLSRSS